jgi:hypothetical protein
LRASGSEVPVIGKLARRALGRVTRTLSRVLTRAQGRLAMIEAKLDEERARGAASSEEPEASPPVLQPEKLRGAATVEPAPAPASIDRQGSARDELSFEQRRRGGPVTGEAPPKIHGPRHTGGGQRRGRSRDEVDDVDVTEALFPDLPLVAYDELTLSELERRLTDLSRDELRSLLRYEAANKNRKSVIETLSRRLAA